MCIRDSDKFFGQLSNGHVTQSTWKDGNYIANYSRFGMLLNLQKKRLLPLQKQDSIYSQKPALHRPLN